MKKNPIIWKSRSDKPLTWIKWLGNLAIILLIGSYSILFAIADSGGGRFVNPLVFNTLAAILFVSIPFVVLAKFRKCIYGQDTFKLASEDGKLKIEAHTKKGLLDNLGYHNHYNRVTVEKVLKDLSCEILGFNKEFQKLETEEEAEYRLQDNMLVQEQKIADLKLVAGTDITQEITSLNKAKSDFEKAHAQVEATKHCLENLISDRTLAALKANEKIFSTDDQKKMTSNYIHQAVKMKFAL